MIKHTVYIVNDQLCHVLGFLMQNLEQIAKCGRIILEKSYVDDESVYHYAAPDDTFKSGTGYEIIKRIPLLHQIKRSIIQVPTVRQT